MRQLNYDYDPSKNPTSTTPQLQPQSKPKPNHNLIALISEKEKMASKDLFSAQNLSVDAQSSWHEWTAIGDRIQGKFVSQVIQPATKKGYKDQLVVTLAMTDGTYKKIGLSDNKVHQAEVAKFEVGQMVGIEWEKSKDTGYPNPARIFKFYAQGR